MKKLMLSFGLALLSLTSAQLSAFFGDSCCNTSCCEDGPLSCNAFSVQVKGGVAPSHFTNRGRVQFTNPTLIPPVFFGSSGLKFDKIFDTPWQVGAELAWNASSHVQFFTEYVYTEADGKKRHFFADTLPIELGRVKFKTNSWYLGARYFFDSLWESECMGSISPFVGFKGGLVWHEGERNRIFFNGVDLGNMRRFKRDPLMSAGLQLGVAWAFTCNLSAILTFEWVGTQGVRPIRNLPLDPTLTGGITNLSLGNTGKLVSFPITLGVAYTF